MEINKKRFTISVAKKLLYMLEGKTLPSSSLPRWIVDELRIEGLITGIASGSRVSYRLTDPVAFGRYVSDNYTSGTSLERWIEIFSGENKDLQRSMLVQIVILLYPLRKEVLFSYKTRMNFIYRQT